MRDEPMASEPSEARPAKDAEPVKDWIDQHAEALTGHTAEELRDQCRLVPGDDPSDVLSWTVACPKGLLTKPAAYDAVKAVLRLQWARESAGRSALLPECPRDPEGPMRDRIFAALASHWGSVKARQQCEANKSRCRAGGKKQGANNKRAASKRRKLVVAEWRAYEKQGRPDPHIWAGCIARKFDIPVRTVRRYLKQAGCSK